MRVLAPSAPVRDEKRTRYVERQHVVTGTRAEVATVLRHHADRGTLVAPPGTALALPDGTVRVCVTIREPAQRPAPARTRRTRGYAVGAAIVVTVVVVAAVVVVVVALVTWVVAHLAQIVGAAALLVVLLAVAARTGHCPGLHCGGCSR